MMIRYFPLGSDGCPLVYGTLNSVGERRGLSIFSAKVTMRDGTYLSEIFHSGFFKDNITVVI